MAGTLTGATETSLLVLGEVDVAKEPAAKLPCMALVPATSAASSEVTKTAGVDADQGVGLMTALAAPCGGVAVTDAAEAPLARRPTEDGMESEPVTPVAFEASRAGV